MPLGPFDPIPIREKVRRAHVNELRAALTGVLDAYDVALADGFVGTQAEWLASLVGAKGDPGTVPIDEVATVGDLATIVDPAIDDVYTVAADGHAHRWNGAAWIDIGQWRGDPGPGGIDTDLRDRTDPGVAAPVTPRRAAGPRLAVTGDSIALGGAVPGSGYLNGNAEVTLFAALASDGRIHLVSNNGINGQDSTQVLARFAADMDAIAPAPDAVWIYAGTNDYPAETLDTTTRTNIAAMVALATERGIVPILGTLVPSDSRDATHRAKVDDYNDWLVQFGRVIGVPVLDLYTLAADGTGNWIAGYSDDGLHPNPRVGAPVLGAGIAADLARVFPADAAIPLIDDARDPNLLANGLMAGTGTATGWTIGGNALGTATITTSADADAVGQWQTVELAGAPASAARTIHQDVTSGFAPGDRLRFAGRLRMVDKTAQMYATVSLNFDAGGSWSSVYLSPNIQVEDLDAGTFVMDATVPVGATVVQVAVTLTSNAAAQSGAVALAQATLVNRDDPPGDVAVADIAATGTPDSTTYLDGSGAWSVPVVAPSTDRIVAVTSSDQATTLATAVDVTGLSFAIAAGETWVLDVRMRVGCSGAGGVRLAVSGPAGATWTGFGHGTYNSSQSVTALTGLWTLGSLSDPVVRFASTGWAHFWGTITAGGTAGTAQVQVASQTAGQTSTVYGKTSMLTATKVS